MRDKRLLSLAVLAVALGFAASALADMAVVTLIVNPNGATGTWESKIRLWGDAGPNTAPDGLGFIDFVCTVSGTVAGGVTVDDSSNVAPQSAIEPIAPGGSQIDVGFHKLRRDGGDLAAQVPGEGIMALQPVNYAGGPNDLFDEAVLPGIGVADNAGWVPPADYQIVGGGPGPDWDADTKVAQGTYATGSGAGALTVETAGVLSFSYLEDSGDGTWEGPVGDLRPLVSTVVTQVMTGGTGNGGGLSFDRETTLTIEEGTLTLDSNVGALGNYVRAVVKGGPKMNGKARGDTLIEMTTHQDMLSIAIDYAPDGLQGIDLGRKHLKLYDLNDPNGAKNSILAAIKNAEDTDTRDGLYDSTAQNDQEVVGYGLDNPAAPTHILVRLTLVGDLDLNGAVNSADLGKLFPNLNQGDKHWEDGDFDRNQAVNSADLGKLFPNLNQGFPANPPPGFIPEPGTVALLAVGGLVAAWRRRRRS